MATVPSNANKVMLRWARKKADMTVEQVAEIEKLNAEKIAKWEEGEGTPSLAVLTRLSRRYRYPLMVFYLSEPPSAFGVVRDFRLLPHGVSRKFSPALRRAIWIAQERQIWASAYLEDMGQPKSMHVGTYSPDAPPEALGKDLRTMLGATIYDQTHCRGFSAAFVYWRRLCEAMGVFVFQANGVDVEEMRGFSLPDPYAPAVVVNSRDEFLPKIFSMIHELVHILIGEASVSGAGKKAFAPAPRKKIERFCNQVATEVLVPKADFVPRVPKNWMDHEEEILHQLAQTYWVSKSVIALHCMNAT